MATANPGQPRWYRGWFVRWCCWLLLACCLLSCTSVRPVAKVGLLAPFEGLDRETGYLALAAMRAAIAEAPPGQRGLFILPLALDTSADPLRAAHKLLVDEQVQAVIGPLSVPAIAEVQGLESRPLQGSWLVPLTISNQTAMTSLPQATWDLLLATVAEEASRQGAERLLLAGWPAAWEPLLIQTGAEADALPVVVGDDPALVQANDAIFYGGEPAAAALYLQTVRQTQRDVPFFVGPGTESSVFAAHSTALHAVYVVSWQDAGYTAWAAEHQPASPLAYWVYRATQAAIAEIAEVPLVTESTWAVHIQPYAELK